MRILGATLLLAISSTLTGVVGYKMAAHSQLAAPASEQKWQHEVSLREEQIARLEREVRALRNRNAPAAKQLPSPASPPPVDSPVSSYATERAPRTPIATQNFVWEPGKNGGVSLKNRQGQLLAEFSANGNKVSFGTNTFAGPGGEIFLNRSDVAGDLRSLNSDKTVALTFKNHTAADLHLYWINFAGVPTFYKSIKAGEEHRQETFLTHPWVVIDHDGTKVGEMMPEKDDEEIELTR